MGIIAFPNRWCVMDVEKKMVTQTTSVSSHYGLAIYIKKYLKGKRRIMETQIFHDAKIY